jgi:hypothetical protein
VDAQGVIKMSGKWLFLLAGLATTGLHAQTCATPLPLLGIANTGDTCVAPNSLPGYGGVPSPQREVVYSFVGSANNLTANIQQTGTPFGATILLLPAPCSSSTDPIAIGDFMTPMVIGGLTSGATYYLVVTADPGGPANACGDYALQVTIPVGLQSFSVD